MNNVFISYITEEKPIAHELQCFIEEHFLKRITVFVSSDIHCIAPGQRWLDTIGNALNQCKVILLICSPSSLTRPWINFEAGCGWIKDIKIIPICHSGQRKDQLPLPFSELQALQLDDENFGKVLLEALSHEFEILTVPKIKPKVRQRFKQAISRISVAEASPQIIHSPRERTQLINNDLQTLLNSAGVDKETIWTSAFLSTFAITSDDPYPPEEEDYLKLLLKEKELLIELARRGCAIKCIISPANKFFTRHAMFDPGIQRTKQLIDFIKSNDRALSHIDWAISDLRIKNLYIIGHISCFEGYKKGTEHGYDLTLRQTSRDVINVNIDVYSSFFKDLAARTLAKWTNEHDSFTSQNELLRIGATRCLEESLKFLMNLQKSIRSS